MRALVLSMVAAVALAGCATSTSNANGASSADLAAREYKGADQKAVYAQAQEVLKALKWTIKGGNPDTGVIMCQTPVVMRFGHTGGDDAMVHVAQKGDTVEVTLSAQSGAGLGFDEDNLRQFNAELDKRVAASSATPTAAQPSK